MRIRYFLLLFVFLTSLVHAQKVESGWPDYGGTLAGQRFSFANQIQPTNAAGLQVAWTFHTHVFDRPSSRSNGRASFEATPVLWHGTLYFDSPFDQIFAINAATGALEWTFDPNVDREAPIYIVTSRGVSLWHAKKPKAGLCNSDRVLVATVDRRLIARDATTGQACPRFGDHGIVDLSDGVEIGDIQFYTFTSPPTVVGDTVVLGSSVGDNQITFAASGAVRGFDAVTGKQKWSWEPVRWTAGQHLRTSGSGNAWSVISADPEHDMVFVPTGSASVDFYGGTRIGDNRDADSLVALRASTGERIWGFQFVHHDLWDYDTPSEPVLFSFHKTIPAVAVVTKTSMVFVLNRLTGEPLYPVIEKPVPGSTLPGEIAWSTQPFSTLPPLAPLSFTAADIHLKNASNEAYCRKMMEGLDNHGLFTPPSLKGSVVYPGSLGGANWGSASFDPQTGTLYTRVSNLGFLVKQVPAGPPGDGLSARVERKAKKYLPEWMGGDPPPLRRQFRTPDSGGEQRDESLQRNTPYHLARQALMTPDGTPCAPEPWGSIVAINLQSGEKLWTAPHGVMVNEETGSIGAGGVITTAGGLLFAASTNDPYLRAYDSSSGKELWKGLLPAASNATPMTYTMGGRQYVVIVAGSHGFVGADKNDAVLAYALPQTKSSDTHSSERKKSK